MTGNGASSAFTVVIPAYNAEACIERAIGSVREAAGGRVVVVDDGSQDGTVGLARSTGAVVIEQANAGPGAARNRGIDVVAESGGHAVFLDADDELVPGAVASIERAIAACPSAAAVVGAHVQVGVSGERLRAPHPDWIELGRLAQPWLVLGTAHVFCGTGMTLTARALRSGVRFDSSLRFAEDRDVLYRATAVGEIAISGACLVRKHDTPGQMTVGPSQARRWLSDQLRVARMHGGPGAPEGARRELESVCSWVLKNTCRSLCRAGGSLRGDEWTAARAAFDELGWQLPRGAVKWRLLGRAREMLGV